MITLTREEAQQVLEHLDDLVDAQQWEIDMHSTQYGEGYKPQRMKHMKEQLANTNKTIELLRTRLAQPEPEPIAYLCENAVGHKYFRWKKPQSIFKPIALYTAPPQREWVGLTHEEKMEILTRSITAPSRIEVAEAMLKEKNT